MASPTILDSAKHRQTRIITSRGAEFGESVHFVPVIADELHRLVLEYPVCLIKDNDTGRFGLSALLGFEPGENLYLEGRAWDATYLPLHVRRQPFMIGVAGETGTTPTAENTVITIDVDSPRVSESDGERLFTDDGSRTPYLEDMSRLLSTLVPGIQTTEAYIDALADRDLIAPFQLSVSFAGGEQQKFDGLYTAHDEKLRELTGEALDALHGKGFLQAGFLMLASIGNLQKLIDKRNARRATAA